MKQSSSSESDEEEAEHIPQDVNALSSTRNTAKTTKLKELVLKVSALPPGSGGNQKDEDQVNLLLRSIPRQAQYLQAQQVSKRHYVRNVLPLLRGGAFHFWDLHATRGGTKKNLSLGRLYNIH
jgi:hypothetical protein